MADIEEDPEHVQLEAHRIQTHTSLLDISNTKILEKTLANDSYRARSNRIAGT